MPVGFDEPIEEEYASQSKLLQEFANVSSIGKAWTFKPNNVVPSPSGSKLLVVRNSENESPMQFEIWSGSQMEEEFPIPHSIHDTYTRTDGLKEFLGILMKI